MMTQPTKYPSSPLVHFFCGRGGEAEITTWYIHVRVFRRSSQCRTVPVYFGYELNVPRTEKGKKRKTYRSRKYPSNWAPFAAKCKLGNRFKKTGSIYSTVRSFQGFTANMQRVTPRWLYPTTTHHTARIHHMSHVTLAPLLHILWRHRNSGAQHTTPRRWQQKNLQVRGFSPSAAAAAASCSMLPSLF